MLQGFYGARKAPTGANRGHLDPQAMLWSRSLRGTHDNAVKKLRKEMEAKRRNRLRKTGVLREPMLNSDEEDIAPRSASRTPPRSRETPAESPRRPRPKSAEVQGAKKLLKILHLEHMLSDDDEDVESERASKKRGLKEKTRRSSRRRSTSCKKTRSREDAPSPVKRDVSPLTSWRMDASLPEALREKPREAKKENVTMSSQKAMKKCAESDQDSEDEEEDDDASHVTQWRYKPLPGEQVRKQTRERDSADANPKKDWKPEMPNSFDFNDLRVVVVAMQKEHRQCIRSVAESLEHHTRQMVLLTKANSSLADHVESLEKEIKVLRAMQYVCTTIP